MNRFWPLAAAVMLVALGTGSTSASAKERWREVDRTIGDLTGDGVPDIAIVRKLDAPANIVRNDGFGPPVLDTNPRELVVLAAKGGGYRPILRSTTLLPPEGDAETPCLADPLDENGIAIERGLLIIRLQTWLSCGSYGVTNRTLKFRFEQGRFRLIGSDRLEFSRASGLGEETSINYLTGRKKVTSNVPVIEAEDGDERPVSEENWGRIERETIYLDEMDRVVCDDWDSAPDWC